MIDESDRPALIALLESQLGALRSVKDMEFQWLDRYCVLVLPAVGALALKRPIGISVGALCSMLAGYFGLTVWMHYVLHQERRSYYRLLRSVVRIQNILGILDLGCLPDAYIDGPFPMGMGVLKDRNGTRPNSSFLTRNLYISIVFIGLMLAAAVQPGFPIAVPVSAVALEVIVFAGLFEVDSRRLQKDARNERNLVGNDPSWFPPEGV